MEFIEVEKYTYLQEKYKDYIEELKEHCKQSKRLPKYHIYPPCGLMNDPNGLCYFEGKYHVFYQWFPFEPNHGMKHWAHVTSSDLIHWNWSEEMLIPDQEYEKNGCYSGNSIGANGKQYLFYTANYKTQTGRIPKQALAIMEKDGTIHKYEKNPVIDGAPEGMSGEIRDPYVFEKNGFYYMMLGGSDLKGQGQLMLYKSDNLLDWDYQGNIDLGRNDLGRMYECPAYMEINKTDVLLLSFIGIEPQKERYQNEFTTLYFTGKLDLENLRFETYHVEELDKGFDFYAPQMFSGKNQRPLMFGWIGCGVQELPYAKEDMWQHALTMPRQLEVRENQLYQTLAEEAQEQFPVLEITKEALYPEETAWKLHLEVEAGAKKEIIIGEAQDCLKIEVDALNGKITIDRSQLKHLFSEKYGTKRSCYLEKEKAVALDLYYDNTFAELYINEGKEVMTFRLFPEVLKIEIKENKTITN